MRFPSSLQELIDEFNKFPGVGPKTAERFVFYLLKQSGGNLQKLSAAISSLKEKTVVCSVCFDFSEKNPCPICSDSKRDQTLLCIVAKPQDLAVIENTREYNGLYHVLGENLNVIRGISPEQLRIRELTARLQGKNKIKEVIIATNYDLDGETTALYLIKLLKPLKIKISRLARGLPMGSDLEYADEITLSSALKERREI